MVDHYSYIVEQDTLVIQKGDSEKILWRGRPLGLPVRGAYPIEHSDDCIVLLDWRTAADKGSINLLRINPEGNIIWEINMPDADNQYLGITRDYELYVKIGGVSERIIEAHSGSGFLDSIDVETGDVMKSEFTK